MSQKKKNTKNVVQTNAKNGKNTKTALTAKGNPPAKKQPEKKQFDWKAWLISLAITLALVGVILGIQYWLTVQFEKTVDIVAFWKGNLIGDAIGGFIMLFIVHHFVKKPKKDPYGQQ